MLFWWISGTMRTATCVSATRNQFSRKHFPRWRKRTTFPWSPPSTLELVEFLNFDIDSSIVKLLLGLSFGVYNNSDQSFNMALCHTLPLAFHTLRIVTWNWDVCPEIHCTIANYKSPMMETMCGLMSQFQAETMFWCFMKAPISKLMNSRSCPTQSKFPGHCVCRGGCATCWGSGQPWPGAGAPPTQPQQGDTRPQPAQQGHIFLSLYVTCEYYFRIGEEKIPIASCIN